MPSLPSRNDRCSNLPAARTRLIGRDAERAWVGKLLTDNRLVTLVGAGGCGKTRLALAAAAELAARYDGIWWVDLARLSTGAFVANAIASTVGVKESLGQPLLEGLAQQLRSERTLLLLDNCEHVVAACAELVHVLLDCCPSLAILATSREPVAVDGEIAWRVPSLGLPERTRGQHVLEAEAVRLFVDRARHVQADLSLDHDAVEAIAEICRRLDGIPLAIEMAAAQTRLLSVRQIATGLNDRFRVLVSRSRTALPRHQTLRASVDWSHDLLSDRERVVLASLSVFAGGFSLEAAERVCAIERVDALHILGGLVDRSMVQAGEELGAARYQLLETIRQYAAERLAESGDGDAIRGRHLEFFVDMAERAGQEMEGAGLLAWLAILDAEHDNLRAAFDWAVRTDETEQCLRIAAGVWMFWMVRGHLTEGRSRFDVALGSARDSGSVRARALIGAGQLMAFHGDFVATREFARDALAIARKLGDNRLHGRALDTLGYAAAFLDPAAAPRLFEESEPLLRAAGDDLFLADALNGLGLSRFLSGDYPGSAAALEDGVACARRNGNESILAIGLGMLGHTRVLQGRFAAARTHLEDALVLARRLGDRVFTAQALYSLGLIHALRGEQAFGAELLADSVAIARDASPMMLSFALLNQGHARTIAGDFEGARASLDEACTLAQEMALPWVTLSSLALLGNATRLAGDLDRARTHIEAAMAVATATGLRTDLAIDAAARLARATGDPQRAESLHHEALAAARAADSVLLVPTQLEALAGLAADAHSLHESARLFGAAEVAREVHAFARSAVDRADYDRDLARLGSLLPEAELRVSWDEGRAMSLAEAVSYAARGRGERKRPAFGWPSLTPTELEVVRHVACGLTNPEIARRLFVSRATIKAHLSHIFAKLEVSTRAELAAQAMRRGVVPASE